VASAPSDGGTHGMRGTVARQSPRAKQLFAHVEKYHFGEK